MDEIFWYAKVNSPVEHMTAAAIPLLLGFLLYQCDYLFICVRYLTRLVEYGTTAPVRDPKPLPAALVVLPTLLRNADELEGLIAAMTSAMHNNYTGPLYIIAAIDDGIHTEEHYGKLLAWSKGLVSPPNVHVYVTSTTDRAGKALAIEAGIQLMKDMVSRGEVSEFPPIFYNMDADGRLGPQALAHMADTLLRRSRITKERPMIVASNVCIASEDYWRGWRSFFSVRGQLALCVAAEYLTTISIGKINARIVPIANASGALYCTWSALHLAAPRWASFMQTLRFKHWIAWWLGMAPPRFADHQEENAAAQTGPGDDTWMTWLALTARWVDNKVHIELPRTPAHAFYYMLKGYFFRPFAYSILGRIETKTPTTIKALFKQRVRWNSSRIHDAQRWRPALAFVWAAGMPVALSTLLLLYMHGAVIVSLLIWPFISTHATLAAFAFAFTLNFVVRALSIAFALLVDGARAKSGYKFLALPVAAPYTLVFHTMATVWGIFSDVFLFGVNTKFSPEKTHIQSRLSHIAISYRVRRAFALAVRAVIHNDVPLGTFWFGWYETPWTPNGYEGWTTGRKRVLLPRVKRAAKAALEAAPASIAVESVTTPTLDAPLAIENLTAALDTPIAISIVPARLSIAPPLNDVAEEKRDSDAPADDGAERAA